MVGEVAIDDCRYVDPCTRPNTCEHGGICSIREDRVICNCDNTGKNHNTRLRSLTKQFEDESLTKNNNHTKYYTLIHIH